MVQRFAGVLGQDGREAGYGVEGVDVGVGEGGLSFFGDGGGEVGDELVGVRDEGEGSFGFVGEDGSDGVEGLGGVEVCD